MNIFLSYIREFIRTTHPGLLLFSAAFTALIIFLNYRYRIEPDILRTMSNRQLRFAGYYLVYWMAFAIPYLVIFILKGNQIPEKKFFFFMIMAAPAIFALKVNFSGLSAFIMNHMEGTWARYWAIVANLPSKMFMVVIPLFFIFWLGKYPQPFFGVSAAHFNWTPYLLMLCLMVPLIAAASTQADFLHTYPKLRQVAFIKGQTNTTWIYNLLYEIVYGIDFITIELFFRGFLVLAFVRFVGQDAIVPMAVFYCSIHFGKPLAECISSFFGGMLLGIVVYNTGSIAGGLIVHLGIAWMTETGGYIGNMFRK
jgi:hypothetical protein